MPHTAEFIKEMQQKLLAEQSALKKELGHDAHQENGDYQANFPEYGRNSEENATEIADYAASFATVEAMEDRLKEVEAAIGRIEVNTYGITAEGHDIPEDRLRANPAATTLVKPTE